MFEYTKNNHFKFGYNGLNEYQKRQSPEDIFTFSYGRIENNTLNWKDANESAAKAIFNKNSDLNLLLSGGMDSEICLRSFYDQNLRIQTTTLRFTDIDQSSELHFVHKLIRKYNLSHKFIDLNLKDFVKSNEFKNLSESLECVSPIIICHLWLANQIDSIPIIAQGEVHLKKQIPDNYQAGVSEYGNEPWHLYESERLCSIYLNFIHKDKPAIPGFFQYLPEQTHSFLTQNSYLKNLVSNQIHGKLGTRTSKNIMSQQFYPDIEMRPKLHGWESVEDFHDKLRLELAQKFPFADSSASIEYHALVKKMAII